MNLVAQFSHWQDLNINFLASVLWGCWFLEFLILSVFSPRICKSPQGKIGHIYFATFPSFSYILFPQFLIVSWLSLLLLFHVFFFFFAAFVVVVVVFICSFSCSNGFKPVSCVSLLCPVLFSSRVEPNYLIVLCWNLKFLYFSFLF